MEAIATEEQIVEKWMTVNRSQMAFRTSIGVSDLNEAASEFRGGAICTRY
jgi:hypothetical protein